jgi:hypothetical protein
MQSVNNIPIDINVPPLFAVEANAVRPVYSGVGGPDKAIKCLDHVTHHCARQVVPRVDEAIDLVRITTHPLFPRLCPTVVKARSPTTRQDPWLWHRVNPEARSAPWPITTQRLHLGTTVAHH